MHSALLLYQHAHRMEQTVFLEEHVLKPLLHLPVLPNQMDLNVNGLLLMEMLLHIVLLKLVQLLLLILLLNLDVNLISLDAQQRVVGDVL
jgi:hypothetical protein